MDILNNSKYEVLTDEGFKDFKGLSIDYNNSITLKTDSCSLSCTEDHEIYFEEKKKKRASDFLIGESVITSNGLEKIKSIVKSDVIEKVYDLIEVNDVNSFYCNKIKVSNCLILDEFAHVDNNIADEFYTAVFPTISSGTTTKLVIISTPNKYNLYHKIWTDAIHKRNTFNPIRVDWFEVPGHDEAWRAEQIANTSKEQFAQEHELSFDSSSNGLINSGKIKELVDNHTEPILKDDDDCLFIYEKPIEGEEYIIVVDSSHGVDRDYSAFGVIKISTSIHELVAVYRNNKISPLVYPNIIYKVGINYNEAHILVENNDIGNQVATILLYEYEYPNLLFTELTNKKQRVAYGNDGKTIIGVKTTAGVKNIGCSNLKAAIEHNKLIIKDYNTISELSTFIKVKDSYQADDGSHDDLVMVLVLYAWLLTQNFFKDVEQNLSSDIKDIYEDSINENMLGFGFFTSGKPDELAEDEDEDLIDRRMGWTKVNGDDFDFSLFH